MKTGASTTRPCDVSFTTSPLVKPNLCAECGLISAALSHVSLVMGLGTSCNQELLTKLPSAIEGSGRRTTSIPELCLALGAGIWPVNFTGLAGKALLATAPLSSEVSQNSSNFGPGFCRSQ